MHRGLPLVLVLAACAAETLEIDLLIEAPDCAPSSFEQVSNIEIAVFGEHDGQPCLLDQRCLWQVDLEYGTLEGVDDFESAMRAANPPLVSGLLAGAQHVKVNGRESDCYANDETLPSHPMCGGNDFAEVEDGSLPIVLTCDPEPCRREDVELCP